MKLKFSMTYKVLSALLIMGIGMPLAAQDETPRAPIINDEGGAVRVAGLMNYTNPFLTSGLQQPVLLLEDQGGFVVRDEGYIMPPESQVLGQFTSDFFDPPVSYSITLPQVPGAPYRDVDNDDAADTGLQVYAVAFWENVWGDPYLEARDLFGGGWSGNLTTVRLSSERGDEGEVIGGSYLVYAPDDAQGFPSEFGDDGLLFTEDDPVVLVPEGWTVVNLDTTPFTFDRSREPQLEIYEAEGAELVSFADLSYVDAFDAMIQLFREEYAFTDYKNLDWDAISTEFRPRFEQAMADNDSDAYAFAMRDFTWVIPDGHVSVRGSDLFIQDYVANAGGGLGFTLIELDDGRFIVNYILPDGPAESAGIEPGAEVTEIDGERIDDALENVVNYEAPASLPVAQRYNDLRFLLRSPVGTNVEIAFQNPEGRAETARLISVEEQESLNATSANARFYPTSIPVDFRILGGGVAYVQITDFNDSNTLTIQLWERMIEQLNENAIPNLIIDMRFNGGGSGWLADQMAAYFFDEPLITGYGSGYDIDVGEYVTNLDRPRRFYLPPEELRYDGEIAVLVGLGCASACEFFSYDMSLQDRAAIIGQYPSAGLGGGVSDFDMPEGLRVRFTVARELDADQNIHLEGIGVQPTIRVPIDEESVLSQGDIVLDYAFQYFEGSLDAAAELNYSDGGSITVGETVEGEIAAGERITYTLEVEADSSITLSLRDDGGTLDSYLRVYDESGELIVENDDIESGVSINSVIKNLAVRAGDTLIIEVGTFDDADSGDYTLEVR